MWAAIDCEIANPKHDSLCSLGLVVYDGFKMISQHSWLINPMAEFHANCIRVHGITADQVKDMPILGSLWLDINSVLEPVKYLVAHNASFDFSVLTKSAMKYQLNTIDKPFICTLSIANRLMPDRSNKLKNLADLFGIKLNHHNAISDASACGQVLIEFARLCDCTHPILAHNAESIVREIPSNNYTLSSGSLIREFLGLAKAVVADGKVSTAEAMALHAWIMSNTEIITSHPFDKIAERIIKALEDGEISNEESSELMPMLEVLDAADFGLSRRGRPRKIQVAANDFNTKDVQSCDILKEENKPCINSDKKNQTPLKLEFDLLQANDLKMYKKAVCLSGVFATPRAQVESALIMDGADIKSSVSNQTELLIVGLIPSDDWKFGSYGLKIEKALRLRNEGCGIRIISEADLPYF